MRWAAAIGTTNAPRVDRLLRFACLAIALATVACAEDEAAPAPTAQPAPLADHECAVCGMTVSMQTAPRAQAIHRDGTHVFFCSIGDWQVHAGAPSPHGPITASFVEVMDDLEDPLATQRAPQPWEPAGSVHYVIGVPREGVMGEPVLTFTSERAAARVESGHPAAARVDPAGLAEWWSARSN